MVPAVSLAAHTLDAAMLLKKTPEVITCILNAPVTVNH